VQINHGLLSVRFTLMSEKVSGILFDIGGVLVALDGVPSLARLLQIEASYENIHKLWMACPSVVLHETGKISALEFAEQVVTDLALPASPSAFLVEFTDWLEAPHPGAFDLVGRIPGAYRVAALSNMSALHWNRIKAMGLPARFEATYVSHEIGYLKPSQEAFQIALNGMALPPAEVLFLDDGAANVKAAIALGMKAHVVRNPEQARVVLESYGVLAAPTARR
jgi:HAD superfamily hydrolase (TIGR01509 family)